MTTTVGQAIEQRDSGPGVLIKQYSDSFAQVLPSHIRPETFVRLSQGLLRRDEKLRKAAERNPGSFLAALMDCARLGHEPGTDQYALVPFGDEVTGIEQYQGEIERMYRAGAVASVKAEIVYTGDRFVYDPGTMDRPEHTIDWWGDRGKPVGGYAYAIMKDGATSKVVVMNEATINRHKKESKTANRSDSPWVKWWESMWLKTFTHELEKWVPTSAEYRREQLRAAVEAHNLRTATFTPTSPGRWQTDHPETGQATNLDTGEIADAVVVPEEQTPAESPASA